MSTRRTRKPKKKKVPDSAALQAVRLAIDRIYEGKVEAFRLDLGCSRQAAYMWKRRERSISAEYVEALEKLLERHGTSIEDLLLEHKVPRRIHFRGHWISPGDRAYEAVESTIGPVIKAADPELAKKLKL